MESEVELAVEKIEQLNIRNQRAMMELIKRSLKMNDDEFNKELLLAYAHQNPVHILEVAVALQYEDIIKTLPEKFV
ncbi:MULTISPECIES: hypothetical protein [unclassified Paenibacillus]|uniref:hypothetical protein n=1 Tax=unclassified Paenibacillus TaxID=185978 RepID=UPI001AE6CBB0|nr:MULTISPECIES: hypothetical protein [unclassified Paenibacillus]MBP1155548.1 hypothetical protein [Paenibacillus sp. PvP091]MBP1169066.1 hypothetical protein [Paenibacillus sp. PvR098]MBP2440094.1 hypothetical protein [Paenibacillus sp. PvP052]